jgi:hypothetical protein
MSSAEPCGTIASISRSEPPSAMSFEVDVLLGGELLLDVIFL